MPEVIPGLYMVGPIPPGTRLILAWQGLLEEFAARDEQGRKVTADWGEVAPEGYYTPIFKVEDDGKVLVDRYALENAEGAAVEAAAEADMERNWRETLQIAIEKTLTHPSIRAKIRRRLEFALNDNERLA